MKLLPFNLIAVSLFLSGCVTYTHPEPKSAKEELQKAQQQAADSAQTSALALPSSVRNDLLALPNKNAVGTSTSMGNEKRLRVAAQDVDAADFFASLFQGSRYSVAVHPDVSGTITLELKDVTLTEVLDTVADIYGYEIKKSGNIYNILPAGLRTETIPVNYLMMSRNGRSMTSVSSGGVVNNDENNNDSGSSDSFSSDSGSDSNSGDSGNSDSSSSGDTTTSSEIETSSKSDYWKELEKSLQTLIGAGNGRSVVTSPQAGLVTVRAYPNELRAVRDFLKQTENHLKRQVVLEAKILEVSLSEGYQQGIDWYGLSGSWDNGKGAIGGVTNPIMNTIQGGLGMTITDGNFLVAVELLKMQGDVNTLSSPRVTATNNQKAVIKVGTDEYFVTDVTSNFAGTDGGDQTTDVEISPFFSGVALDVTPQIDENGRVLLHIHPSVIEVVDGTKDLPGYEAVPLAKSYTRESDTVVEAKSGDIIVIGGLMKTEQQEIKSTVPWVGDIPIFGEAFTSKQQTTRKVELVILLKPTVVGGDTWTNELQRSKELLDKWYPNRDL